MNEQSDYEATAVPYIEQVIPEIASWDPDVFWRHYDAEAKSSASREDIDQVISRMSELGSLVSLGSPNFQKVTASASTETGSKKLIVYGISAVFENGEATISLTLVDRGGELSIYGLNIDSPIFQDDDDSD